MTAKTNPATIYVLLGPTGSGKTSLTQYINPDLFEIVSCDSRQVYREMPLGTAMPDAETLSRIRHHCIECISPDESMDASQYSELAHKAVRDIFARGKTPFVVGGTGFYYLSLKTTAFEAPSNPGIRDELGLLTRDERRNLLSEKDPSVLVSPGEMTGAGRIHPNDDYRITRALEVILSTGILWSEHWKEKKSKESPEFYYTGWYVEVELESYRERVMNRAAQMIEMGFLEEAGRIYEKYGNCPGLRSLGYREALQVLSGEMEKSDLYETLGNLHYQYGRKQRTWFKREKELTGISLEQLPQILEGL